MKLLAGWLGGKGITTRLSRPALLDATGEETMFGD